MVEKLMSSEIRRVLSENCLSESANRRGWFAAAARKSNSASDRLPDATPERLVYQNFSLASNQRR